MKRMILATAIAVAGSSHAFAGGNLLFNPDMSRDDGVGFPLGWSYRYTGTGKVAGSSIVPGGDGEFTIRFPNQLYLVQNGLALVPGERYRISAEVRTSGLSGGKGMRFGVWDLSWDKEEWSEPFPSDTRGAWVPVSWEGIVQGSRTNGYNFSVAGTTGSDPSARLDMRKLRFEAVSEAAKQGSRPLDGSLLKTFPSRIVPIDPKLGRIPPDGCEMTFYWPGRLQDGYRLVAAVDGRELPAATFGERRRAKVRVGALTVGRHGLSVRIEDAKGGTVAKNDYPLRVIAAVKPGYAGKKLNNFVTEVFNGRLRNGETPFHLPKDTWTWISFEGAKTAEGCLDNSCLVTVKRREGERYNEAMRFLAAGDHVLHVTGAREGDRLRIHMVKTLSTTGYNVDRRPCSQNQGLFVYSLAFAKRFFLPSFNTTEHYHWKNPTDRAGFYAERGIAVNSCENLGYLDPRRLDVGKCYQAMTDTYAWRHGFDLEIDESGIGAPRTSHANFAEACWRMVGERPAQCIHSDWCDAPNYIYETPAIEASEISAIVNSGDGRGMLYPEIYSACLADPQRAYDWEHHFSRFARSAIDMVPAAKDSVLYYFAAYIDLGSWSDYPCPEGDLKAHYAHFVRTIALEPEFDGTIGGLAFGAIPHCEEEVARWMAKVIRYYAVEGGTGDLNAEYGFRYLPGLVKDPDFVRGLAAWKAEPAADGGLAAEKIKDYGTRVQGRKKVPAGTGDGVAVFTRSAKGPNRLSQEIAGLEPGRYYSLLYCTADRDNLAKPGGKHGNVSFLASLEGSADVKDLRFRHVVDRRDGVRLVVHRQVFKATAERQRLVFSDWNADGTPEAAVGSRCTLNYVIFRPYYVENEAEVAELAAFFQGR